MDMLHRLRPSAESMCYYKAGGSDGKPDMTACRVMELAYVSGAYRQHLGHRQVPQEIGLRPGIQYLTAPRNWSACLCCQHNVDQAYCSKASSSSSSSSQKCSKKEHNVQLILVPFKSNG